MFSLYNNEIVHLKVDNKTFDNTRKLFNNIYYNSYPNMVKTYNGKLQRIINNPPENLQKKNPLKY